ncbi:hypothetical protein K450DRAFT_254784 [Umbelopsis ramanniana AG]|uniref:Uncharacterized protein n=1 Tax=Umbelopsis ramanniana AG TaxID=1314678 RepID=A0AAD5E598_UMBRA|nr:uncharacterized protein K450DRAFT_254784 [Umbelopsis ramanniana AG]KAI8576889.1 hypothetical protein K450DRAFT_254784 [Umbelopsis ramanniana AG]
MPHMPFLSSRVLRNSPPAAKLQDMFQHGRRRSSSQSSRRTNGSNENDSLEDSSSHNSHRLSHIIAKHFPKKQEVVQEHEIDFPTELQKLQEKFESARTETNFATVSQGSVYYHEDYITCEDAIREMTEAWSLLMDLVDRDTWRVDDEAQSLEMDIKALIDVFACLPRIDRHMDDNDDE